MRPFITEDWVFVSFNTWVESSNSQFYPVFSFPRWCPEYKIYKWIFVKDLPLKYNVVLSISNAGILKGLKKLIPV